MSWMLIAIGAALGAPARFWLDTAISAWAGRRLPWGTVAVNLAGAGLLGFMVALASRGATSELSMAAVGTGFCGSFTTFSAFTWETLALAEDGAPVRAAANLLGSLTLGIAIAAGGFALGLSG